MFLSLLQLLTTQKHTIQPQSVHESFSRGNYENSSIFGSATIHHSCLNEWHNNTNNIYCGWRQFSGKTCFVSTWLWPGSGWLSSLLVYKAFDQPLYSPPSPRWWVLLKEGSVCKTDKSYRRFASHQQLPHTHIESAWSLIHFTEAVSDQITVLDQIMGITGATCWARYEHQLSTIVYGSYVSVHCLFLSCCPDFSLDT